MSWLRKIRWGCLFGLHRYEIHDTYKVTRCVGGYGRTKQESIEYHLRCSECGKMHIKTF